MPIHLSLKEAERHVIDTEIEELENRIRVLRTKRNYLAPISSLPSEVLVRIFRCVEACQITAYEWTAVTHVCHHWRAVALGTGVLWSTIVYANMGNSRTSRSWAVAAFQRSAKCKLSVQFVRMNPPPEDLSFILSVLAELSRIRHIVLALHVERPYYSEELEQLAVLLQNPAPALESFHFICGIFSPTEEEGVPRSGFRNDITWFNGISPQLQSLILHFPGSDLTGLRCENLTSLEILLHKETQSFTRISFPALLKLLSETSKLEDLHLDHAYTVEQDVSPRAQSEQIFLGSLVRSKLSSRSRELFHFLAAVSIPSKTRVVITASDVTDLTELLNAMQGHFQDGVSPPWAMSYSLQDTNHLCIEFYAGNAVMEGGAYLTVNLFLHTDAPFYGLDLLPISQLQTLHLSQSYSVFELPDSHKTFGWCCYAENITSLDISGEIIDPFINFVKENIDTFTALTCLTFRAEEETDKRILGWILDQLITLLEQRMGLTSPLKLQKLILADFGAYRSLRTSRSKMEKLKPLVSELWVGEESVW